MWTTSHANHANQPVRWYFPISVMARLRPIVATGRGRERFSDRDDLDGLHDETPIEDADRRLAKLVLGLAAAVLVMGQDYMAKRDLLRFEYPLLVALAVLAPVDSPNASPITLGAGTPLGAARHRMLRRFEQGCGEPKKRPARSSRP